TINAPSTAIAQQWWGQADASYTPPRNGRYTIAIRITRPVPLGEEVVQYVDNITAQGPCYANCDGTIAPPVLTVNDYSCFLNRFPAGDPYANCDGSPAPPTLNVADFLCFINAFAAGCD